MARSLKTNEKGLVRIAVQGQVVPPRCYGWEVTAEGTAVMLPAVGGITYNVLLGDPAFGWVADHVEPGVSFAAAKGKPDENPNRALLAYACIGNTVRLISGPAEGRCGVVTGKHGGVEHLIVDFPPDVLRKLHGDDRILVEAWGTGLELVEFPDIRLYGLSPELLNRMGLRKDSQGRLVVPVAAQIPPELMGSGVGSNDSFKGDYDLQTQDYTTLERLGLHRLRLGDVVALQDQDTRWGVGYRRGAISIGVVIHGDSRLSGHGPGIQVVMTCGEGRIVPRISADANIARYLGIGRFRSRGNRRSRT